MVYLYQLHDRIFQIIIATSCHRPPLPSMKQSLEKRIILFSFVILSLTILANTGMDIAVFRKDYIQEMQLRSQSLSTALKGNIEKVLALGIDIKDVSGLSDKCREVVQSDTEISY